VRRLLAAHSLPSSPGFICACTPLLFPSNLLTLSPLPAVPLRSDGSESQSPQKPGLFSCCFGGGGSEQSSRDKAVNRGIAAALKEEEKKAGDDIKLLLLGAGEAGKSTIFKQIKIIHDDGCFPPDELMKWRDHIAAGILSSVKAIIEKASEFGHELAPENQEHATYVQSLKNPQAIGGEPLPLDAFPRIESIWKDNAVLSTLQRRHEFFLPDSTFYFVEALQRIGCGGYCPTKEDVLRCRVKTSGMTEFSFSIDDYRFKVIDVGGQRNERRRWIHCFEDVTAVIFVASLAEYDQQLVEQEGVNRMEESLRLFDEVCNSPWFAKTSLILFLNKSDLFKEKIKHVDLNVAFPDYTGGNDHELAQQYIERRFLALNRDPASRHVYRHVTCATDTKNIKFVLDVVKNILLEDNMRKHDVI
jgi:guanine nucleotide-binding protein G(i) subunit alpha